MSKIDPLMVELKATWHQDVSGTYALTQIWTRLYSSLLTIHPPLHDEDALRNLPEAIMNINPISNFPVLMNAHAEAGL